MFLTIIFIALLTMPFVIASLFSLNDDNKVAASLREAGKLYPKPNFANLQWKNLDLLAHGLIYFFHMMFLILLLLNAHWKMALLGGIFWLPIILVHTLLWWAYYRRWTDPVLNSKAKRKGLPSETYVSALERLGENSQSDYLNYEETSKKKSNLH